MKHIAIFVGLLILSMNFVISAQGPQKRTSSVQGRIIDVESKEALGFAFLTLKGNKTYTTLSDDKGNFIFERVMPGRYQLEASYISYHKYSKPIQILSGKKEYKDIALKVKDNILGEVVVTAQEKLEPTSTSHITSEAIQHLQPTSFSDLLELLPGGKTYNPQMTAPSLLSLREASSRLDKNMKIATLGVGFQMDGINYDEDMNLQRYAGSFTAGDYSNVGLGLDLRMFPVDEIESVDIIRGIPSVEHGNISGGLVKVNRVKTVTPYKARFKADKYGQVYALSKGFKVSKNDVINVGFDYINTNRQPINTHTQYHRLTGSIRWNAHRDKPSVYWRWNLNADYTGSFDKVKVNKDNLLQDDYFKSDFSKLILGANATLNFKNTSFLRSLNLNISGKHDWDKIDQDHVETGGHVIPQRLEPGGDWGIFIPAVYTSHLIVDGKPMNLEARFSTNFLKKTKSFKHKLRLGGDFSYNKNRGRGEVFDLATAPGALFYRPRPFKEIPAIERLGLYAENTETWTFGNNNILSLISGVRFNSLLNLDSKYKMDGRWYIDPRFNLMYISPAFGKNENLRFDLTASLGTLTRMPTVSQIYPKPVYDDVAELLLATQDGKSQGYYQTFKWDNVNYDLEPTRNFKWEIRGGIDYDGNKFSITYYREKMNNAFRYNYYWKHLSLKNYDTSHWVHLGRPEDLSNVDYKPLDLLGIYVKPGNGSHVRKEGIEFQFSPQRIKPIYTKLTINGAWFHTEYSYSKPVYRDVRIASLKQLAFVVRYDDYPDGYSRDIFSTNFMADTQVPRLGLIFSTTFQCTWFTKRQQVRYDGTPSEYIDNLGKLHKFTSEDKKKYPEMVINEDPFNFRVHKEPFELRVNLKLSKQITDFAKVSLFVNRLIHYAPDYEYFGRNVRRGWSPSYFGAEMNFNF